MIGVKTRPGIWSSKTKGSHHSFHAQNDKPVYRHPLKCKTKVLGIFRSNISDILENRIETTIFATDE
jgi:hypothetical protein